MPEKPPPRSRTLLALILIAILFAALVGARTSGPGVCTAPPRPPVAVPGPPPVLPP